MLIGLDHGAYVPLVDLGRKLAPLRDEGLLIMGSRFFTHNLREFVFEAPVSQWSREFDDWGCRTLQAGDDLFG
jgi:4,5-DOPA dioxygenase extradiol